jgi:hypothetical protein
VAKFYIPFLIAAQFYIPFLNAAEFYIPLLSIARKSLEEVLFSCAAYFSSYIPFLMRILKRNFWIYKLF